MCTWAAVACPNFEELSVVALRLAPLTAAVCVEWGRDQPSFGGVPIMLVYREQDVSFLFPKSE